MFPHETVSIKICDCAKPEPADWPLWTSTLAPGFTCQCGGWKVTR